MPVYEYTCKKCNTAFDKLVKSITSNQKIDCPKCGSTKTVRALSLFAVGAESAKSSSGGAPSCGRCGGAPGSCGMQ